MKHKEQFRIAHPETVGETDSHFDLSNYADWLDNEYDEAVRQRDELKEALAEQKRLYFNLFDEEIRCMYCEAEISRGSAIILCKECAENTEL